MGNPIDLALIEGALKVGGDVVKAVPTAVKDWRGENTVRTQNKYRHKEVLIREVKDTIRTLSNCYATVQRARNERFKVRADANQAIQKELDEHQSALKKLEQEAERLESELEEKSKTGEYVRAAFQSILDHVLEEYDMLLKQEDFLSEAVTSRLNEVRSKCGEMARELKDWK